MANPIIRKRNPFLAVFLAIFGGGTGFLYLGRWKMAITFTALPILFLATCGWTGIVFFQYAYTIVLAFVIITFIGFVVTAAVIARKERAQVLQWYQRWYFYLIFFAAQTLLSLFMQKNRDDFFAYDVFNIPTGSMAPTLEIGDKVIVDTRYYRQHQPERGQVIVFLSPKDHKTKFIKRIIGIPGDFIAIKNHVVSVNGKVIMEPYIDPDENISQTFPDATYQIPQNQYFVMGDNRDHSADSRIWGNVPKQNISGKAERIVYSYDVYDFRPDRFDIKIN